MEVEEGAEAGAQWTQAEAQAEAEAPKHHPRRRYNRRRHRRHRLHHPEDCNHRIPATAGPDHGSRLPKEEAGGRQGHGLRHPEDDKALPVSGSLFPTPAKTRTCQTHLGGNHLYSGFTRSPGYKTAWSPKTSNKHNCDGNKNKKTGGHERRERSTTVGGKGKNWKNRPRPGQQNGASSNDRWIMTAG